MMRSLKLGALLLVCTQQGLAFQPVGIPHIQRPMSTRTCGATGIYLHSAIDGLRTSHPGLSGHDSVTALHLSPLPSVATVGLSCLLPTSLGFYKSEYGVSYAYGTSVAYVAFLVSRSVGQSSGLPFYHALALIFYGVRLNLFLLHRELFIPRFRQVRERIEERAKSQGNRLSRTPFLVTCAVLYACLTAPLFVAASTATAAATARCTYQRIAQTFFVGGTWAGFGIAAAGDLQKALVKARSGDDTLVSGGIFRCLRHPNYTGEVLGWTSSVLAAFVACMDKTVSWKAQLPALAASLFGLAGIVMVLARATKELENRQKEKYGERPEYKEWIEKSWVGVTM